MAYCILLGLQVDLTGKLNHEEKKALLLRRLLLRVGEVCMERLQPSKITLLQHRHAGLSSLYTREGGPKSFTPMIPAPSAQNPQNKRYTSMRITATNLLKEKRFPGPQALWMKHLGLFRASALASLYKAHLGACPYPLSQLILACLPQA